MASQEGRDLLEGGGACLEGEEYVCWVGEGLVGRESG